MLLKRCPDYASVSRPSVSQPVRSRRTQRVHALQQRPSISPPFFSSQPAIPAAVHYVSKRVHSCIGQAQRSGKKTGAISFHKTSTRFETMLLKHDTVSALVSSLGTVRAASAACLHGRVHPAVQAEKKRSCTPRARARAQMLKTTGRTKRRKIEGERRRERFWSR